MSLTRKEESILKALRVVYDRTQDEKLSWLIIGSMSLWLQGVDVIPEDIDILANRESAFRIGKILQQFEIRPVSFSRSGRYESYFGQYEIYGLKLEVMGDLRILINGEWVSYSNRLDRRVLVEVGGMKLPVTPLKDHLESYARMKRKGDEDKVRKIRDTLEKTSQSKSGRD